MSTNHQPNTSEQTTEVFTDCANPSDQQWIDTVSDWNAVLDAPVSADAGGGDRSTTALSADNEPDASERGDTVSVRPATHDELPAGVEAFVRIEPIADELLTATLETLPSEWLADTKTQTVVQQFVYRFVEQTPETDPTHDRFQSVCDEMDADSLAHLCTAPLYDDRPEMWTEYFEADLDVIDRRVQ